MQARFQRQHRDGIMRVVGCGDDNGIEIGIVDHLGIVGIDLRDLPGIGHFLGVLAVTSTDGGGPRIGVAVKRGQVHGIRPPTRADHSDIYYVA